MISLTKLFEFTQRSDLVTPQMVKSVPNNIFNKSKRKSGEYRNHQEFLEYANQIISTIIDWNPRKLIPLVEQKKIVPLFTWGNGDVCCYSIQLDKVLDFNHKTQDFEPTQWNY